MTAPFVNDAATATSSLRSVLAREGKVLVAAVGVSGFAGGELLRLLASHPAVEIAGIVGRGRAREPIGRSQPHLAALGLEVGEKVPEDARAVFLALPHGASSELAAELTNDGRTIFDLGPDFRLRDAGLYPDWYGWEHPVADLLPESVYGLPELHRSDLARLGDRATGVVGVPGCYPTATLLAVAPLARAGLIVDVVVDAKSGVSGAGREPKPDLTFSEVNETVRPYGLEGHRHAAEIAQELAAMTGSSVQAQLAKLEFVPHLVPMTRGLLATCYVRVSRPIDATELARLYDDAYGDEPFVQVVEGPPSTKHLTGSNFARVHARVQPRTGRVLAIGAIDNLIKGAAGQAIQAFNVVSGLDEQTGLEALPIAP